MATLDFEIIKSIPQSIKDIIFGYLRNNQQILFKSKNNPYYNIPQLVAFIILSFYQNVEYFSEHGQSIKLNKKTNTISHEGKEYGTAYGNININGEINALYIWTIKILLDRKCIYIGLDSSNKKFINDDFSDYATNNNDFYAFCDGYIYNQQILEDEYSELSVKNNDIIKMELNTKDKTLKYYINDKDQGIAFKNIAFKNKIFNLAIGFLSRSTESVQLIDFIQRKI